eukprot:TRINITY_DN2650_c0_g2_i5.p1 TRINITY_DN2650_c0_g2~~TRINITY_DN2650_c0_g2_i5.p1  ORF type:complete len:950 (+),score=205.91 TRINITY_DN2650_c0_g2_i5:1624-4473(+)
MLYIALHMNTQKATKAKSKKDRSFHHLIDAKAEERRGTMIRLFTLLFTMIFFVIMETLVDTHVCFGDSRIDTSVLVADSSISCNSNVHRWVIAFSTIIFVISVVFPFFTGRHLYLLSKHGRLGEASVFASLGALYRPFKDKYAFFHMVQLARKTCLIILLKFLYQSAGFQLLLSFIVNGTYAAIILFCKPFAPSRRSPFPGSNIQIDTLNSLERFSVIICLFSHFASGMFYWLGNDVPTVFEYIMFIVLAGSYTLLVVFAIWLIGREATRGFIDADLKATGNRLIEETMRVFHAMKSFSQDRDYVLAGQICEQLRLLRKKVLDSKLDLNWHISERLRELDQMRAVSVADSVPLSFTLADVCDRSAESDSTNSNSNDEAPKQSVAKRYEFKRSERMADLRGSNGMSVNMLFNAADEWATLLEELEGDARSCEDYETAHLMFSRQGAALVDVYNDMSNAILDSLFDVKQEIDDELRRYNIARVFELAEILKDDMDKCEIKLLNLMKELKKVETKNKTPKGKRKNRKRIVPLKIGDKDSTKSTKSTGDRILDFDGVCSTVSMSTNEKVQSKKKLEQSLAQLRKEKRLLKSNVSLKSRLLKLPIAISELIRDNDIEGTMPKSISKEFIDVSSKQVAEIEVNNTVAEWTKLEKTCQDLLKQFAKEDDNNQNKLRDDLFLLSFRWDEHRSQRLERRRKQRKIVSWILLGLVVMIILGFLSYEPSPAEAILPAVITTGQCSPITSLPEACFNIRTSDELSSQRRHNTTFSGYYYSTIDMPESVAEQVVIAGSTLFDRMAQTINDAGGLDPISCSLVFMRFICDFYFPPCDTKCTPLLQCGTLCYDVWSQCMPGIDKTHVETFLPGGAYSEVIDSGLSSAVRPYTRRAVNTLLNQCEPLKPMDNALSSLDLDPACYKPQQTVTDYSKACNFYPYNEVEDDICYAEDECENCNCPAQE